VALGPRLVLCCSKNNVRKLKNRNKFTTFIATQIHKLEVCKLRDRCEVHKRLCTKFQSENLNERGHTEYLDTEGMIILK
jgi:hypothetical protein